MLLLLGGRTLRLAGFAAGLALFYLAFFELYPALFPLSAERVGESRILSRRIHDRQGNLLREVAGEGGFKAVFCPLEEMDPFLVQTVLTIEDERFYRHRGIDPKALFRAFIQNITAARVRSGASTVTMQLARIVKGHPRNIFGKLGQMITARRLEQGMTKEQILEEYLNRVPLGKGNLGIEAASREYFGVGQSLLSKGQMCLLAGMIQGPGIYNPVDAPEGARARRHVVVERLLTAGSLTPEDAQRIETEPVSVTFFTPEPKAMHFTDFVLSADPPGGEIRTTLDTEMNTAVENLVRLHVESYGHHGLTHAAVVVLDNRTMEIQVMVGSPDYWDGEAGSNNGAVMLRQPGSTLKPFTYGLAFEKGWQPGDVIPDIPVNYQGSGGRLYEPENITREFSGPVLLEYALSRSLNVPAIQLANYVGTETLLATLQASGFVSLDQPAEHYGLGLTLGNGEVSLLELTAAYAMLANRGIYRKPLWQPGPLPEGKRIFREETVFLLTHILSDIRLRIHAFGSRNPLILSFPMAVKTGTSDNWRDNWTVGYTRDFTIGVWAGSFSGEPNNQYAATDGVGPLFHQVANLVNSYYPTGSRRIWENPPRGIVQRKVCPLSGKSPNPFCPVAVDVFEMEEFVDNEVCDVHRQVWVMDGSGEKHPEVFEYLPPIYASWEASMGRIPPPRTKEGQPAETEVLKISHPNDGDRFLLEPGYDEATQTIRLQAEATLRFDTVVWSVNGKRFAETPWPYEALLPVKPGTWRIQVSAGNHTSDTVTIEIR